jgi:hypothetical protein
MKKYVAILISFIMAVYATNAYAQTKIQIGPYFGVVSYMGDLAPLHIRGTTTLAMPTFGAFGSVSYRRYVRADVFLGYGKLGADDKNSFSEDREMRNLNFQSNLWHWGVLLHTDFTVRIFRQLHPTVFVGIGQFRFNPYTTYEGEKVKLQPLRTEGQGHPGYPEPYKLLEWQYPFGVELGWRFNKLFEVSLVATVHATNTDYIDDVSTVYADPHLLLNSTGEIAEILAFRSDEINPNKTVNVGSIRGNSGRNDWYITAIIKVARTMQFRDRHLGKPIRCPY